jgi:glycosyltransferase involved in cell wall biosynthesis
LIVDGIDGVLAPVGDAAALAGVLRATIDREAHCAQLVTNARHKLDQQFSEARIVGDYTTLYQHLLGGRR